MHSKNVSYQPILTPTKCWWNFCSLNTKRNSHRKWIILTSILKFSASFDDCVSFTLWIIIIKENNGFEITKRKHVCSKSIGATIYIPQKYRFLSSKLHLVYKMGYNL